MARLVLDLKDRRPVWSIPEWAVGRISAALPTDWSVAVIESESDGSGDGQGGVRPDVERAIADAEVYLGYGVPAALLRAGPNLKWVHSAAAGVGNSLSDEMRSRDLLFTNSAGIHGPPMAEAVLAMMLHFSRGIDLAVRGMAEWRWSAEDYYGLPARVREIRGSTVGILGMGGVGSEVARRVLALGARVIGVRRQRTPSSDRGERWRPADATGDSERTAWSPEDSGAQVVYGSDGLDWALSQSDFLVVTLPSTPSTRGLIGEPEFARMKPGSVLVNVARGDIVDESALVEALREGRLRGAASDVFVEEPLPDGHPLWDVPGLLITPHISAVSLGFWERESHLIAVNVERFLAGEPLLNQVDREAGY